MALAEKWRKVYNCCAKPSDPSVPVSGSPPSISGLFAGRYAIVQELGRGGSAVVHLARDTATDRLVAIKTLRPELAESIGAHRFLREIRLTGQLVHEFIVPVLDYGERDGLLFCVLAYLDGGTLRARLNREKQLAIGEAIAIAINIANALEAAHKRGLVHRDVKPENILFSNGQAFLADFGIARVLESAGEGTTSTGVVRGTPAYMSPEQASGERTIDERSDIYSLACVLYEMIAGVPAFVGATAQAIIAQRVISVPNPIRNHRPTASRSLERVLIRALATSPADRFQSAQEFASALHAASLEIDEYLQDAPESSGRWKLAVRRRRPIRWLLAGAALVATGVALAATTSFARRWLPTGTSLDSLRFASFAYSSTTSVKPSELQAVARAAGAALSGFSDVSVVPLDSVTDGKSVLSPSVRLARAAGARWLLTLDVNGAGRRRSVSLSLLDVASNREVQRVRRLVESESLTVAEQYASPVGFLLAGEMPDAATLATRDRASLDSWRMLVRGTGELRRWRLDSAEQSMRAAYRLDSLFAPAAIRLAQLQLWRRRPVSSELLAALAGGRGRSLSARDSLLARAVLSMVNKRYPEACRDYDKMRRLDSLDAVGWIGLGDCQTRDRVVIADAKSPSGHRFRTSYQAGLDAYIRATQISPAAAVLLMPRAGSGPFFTSTSRLVLGTGDPPDTARYGAYPSIDLRADTVVLIPYGLASMISGDSRTLRLLQDRALDRVVEVHRNTWLRVARAWTRASPQDAEAWEALATALELRGNLESSGSDSTSAVAALRRAQALTTNARDRLRLSVTSIRLSLKRGDIAVTRSEADAVLRSASAQQLAVDAASAGELAALAALVGRADEVARWAIASAATDDPSNEPRASDIPAQARSDVMTLFANAIVGRCDRIVELSNKAELALGRFVPPARRDAAWDSFMPRALSLAAPCDSGRALLRVRHPMDRLIQMQQLLARRDSIGLRAQFDTLEMFRRADRPGDVALDYTVQEAWLLAQVGDSARALARLRQTLESFPTLGTDLLGQAPQAGAVCRAFQLAAALAHSDAGAAREWAKRRERLCGDRQ